MKIKKILSVLFCVLLLAACLPTAALAEDAVETQPAAAGDLVFTILWDDGSNAAGLRPETAAVTLSSSDGQTYSLTLTEEAGWQAALPAAAEAEDGSPVTWTAAWDDLPEGYTAAVSGSGSLLTMTCAAAWDAEDLTIQKTFADTETDFPDHVNFTVVGRVGDETVSSLEVEAAAAAGYTVTVPGLPVNHKGEAVTYSLLEIDSDGNTVESDAAVTFTPVTRNGDDAAYASAALTLVSTDEATGEKLGGSVFEITFAGSDTAPAFTEEVPVTSGAAAYLITEPGTYTVKEITAPEGYSLNEQEYTVTAAVAEPAAPEAEEDPAQTEANAEDGAEEGADEADPEEAAAVSPLVLEGTAEGGVLTVSNARGSAPVLTSDDAAGAAAAAAAGSDQPDAQASGRQDDGTVLSDADAASDRKMEDDDDYDYDMMSAKSGDDDFWFDDGDSDDFYSDDYYYDDYYYDDLPYTGTARVPVLCLALAGLLFVAAGLLTGSLSRRRADPLSRHPSDG